MAVTYVQSAEAHDLSVDPLIVTLGSNTTAGGLLVAMLKYRAGFTSISDSGSRTWTQQIDAEAESWAPYRMRCYTAPVGAGGDATVVTVDFTFFSAAGMVVFEVAGSDVSTTPFATTAVGSISSGTALDVGPTGSATGLALSAAWTYSDWAAPTGWTQDQDPSGNYYVTGGAHKSISATTATANWVQSASNWADGMIAIVSAAAGGGDTLMGQICMASPDDRPNLRRTLTGWRRRASGLFTRDVGSCQ